jgi:hypothetical protein
MSGDEVQSIDDAFDQAIFIRLLSIFPVL